MQATLVAKFNIPVMSGNVDFNRFFLGKEVKVDSRFCDIVPATDMMYETDKELVCRVHAPSTTDDGWISSLPNILINPDGNVICAILAYIGTFGFRVLDIPEEKHEVNLILGYVSRYGKVYSVIFVEHEWKDGLQEIHLHVRPLNQWGEDMPMVLTVG